MLRPRREYSGLLNFPINLLTGPDASMSLDGTVFAKGAGLVEGVGKTTSFGKEPWIFKAVFLQG